MLKYLFPLVLILTACGGNSKAPEKEEKKSNEEVVAHFANESEMVGSSRVDLQACKLEYSIVSPK